MAMFKSLLQIFIPLSAVLIVVTSSLDLHERLNPFAEITLRHQQSLIDRTQGEIVILNKGGNSRLHAQLIFPDTISAEIWKQGHKTVTVTGSSSITVADTLFPGTPVNVRFRMKRPYNTRDFDITYTSFNGRSTTLKAYERWISILRVAVYAVLLFPILALWLELLTCKRKIRRIFGFLGKELLNTERIISQNGSTTVYKMKQTLLSLLDVITPKKGK